MGGRTVFVFAGALAILIGFTVLDYTLLNDIIPNRGPKATAYDAIKTLVALALSAAIVLTAYADGRATRPVQAPDIAHPTPVVASYVLGGAFVILFVASAPAFHWLGSEDNVVEYASAACGLVGAWMFLSVAIHSLGTGRRLTPVFSLVCAVALFLLAMEEISWGQRIFGFGTPESFAGNRQGEVNLHNFFTTPIHSIYRVGSWAALILLPFLVTFGPRLRLFERFDDFLPGPWLAAMSVPVACFTYNAWPFMPMQVVFFSSLLMMAIFWRHAHRGGNAAAATLFALGTVFLVVAQAVFLMGGDRYIRHWDVTEYQEFFMAMGLAALGWIARERVVRSRALQGSVSG